jgi:hypothetical protein
MREPGKSPAVPDESNFQVGQIKSQELKSAIRDMFHNGQLQLPTNQPMTATEIERRYEIMNRTLGPTVGRLEYEHTNVVVLYTLLAMSRKGALPEAPPEVQEAAATGDHFDIVSEGPLSRAQKGSDVLAIERTLQIAMPIAAQDPSAMDVMKLDEAVRVVMEASNVPVRVFASEEEVQQTRDARAKAQAQEQKMQELERLSGAAKNVAPVLASVKPQGGAAPAMPAAA